MNCQEAQELLLQIDSLETSVPPWPIREHVEGCAACHEFYRRLCRLEQAVAWLPEPEGSAQANAKLQRMLDSRLPARPRVLRINWNHRVTRSLLAVAASILLAIGGITFWHAMESRQEAARTDLITQMVSWNVGLGQVATPAERTRAYTGNVDTYRQRMARLRLTPLERRLLVRLLEDADWLAQHNDALAEADRFSETATILVNQMDSAATGGQSRMLQTLGKSYYSVVDKGVNAKLEQARRQGLLKAERDARLVRILLNRSQMRGQLQGLMNRSPGSAREFFRQALLVSGDGADTDPSRIK